MTEDENKITHIVQQGENLGELTKYYTGGNNYGEVAQNNGISDANKIYVGQEIEFSVSSDSKYAQENPRAISNQTDITAKADASTRPDAAAQTSTTVQSDAAAQTSTTVQSDAAAQTSTTAKPDAAAQTDATTQIDTPAQVESSEQTETTSQKVVAPHQNDTQMPVTKSTNTTTYNKPSNFSNKWLCPSCPVANDFNVDKTHTDYYIGYLDSKQSVTSINDSWKNIKSYIETLKNNIETLKQAIDSQDYRKQTSDFISSIDNAISNLENNFTALFNAVVNRLIEAAASDEWFSETAIEYATFISESILGKPAPASKTNISGATPVGNGVEEMAAENIAESITTPEPQLAGEQISQSTPSGRVSNSDAVSKLGITEDQLDIVKATIRHEAGNNPDEMLVVASVIKNRMDSGIWGGTDAYSVTTAKGQFESYLKGHYKQYTDGNYYQGGTQEDVDAISEQINAILTGSAEPLTDAERFRSGNGEG
ncbi:MAG: cell wall hydrolase, partial [Bacilli bacterium]|nr:cell wall hydrolase [Bacilli bacterium]